MRFFQRQRIDFIFAKLAESGSIRRADIMAAFEVSIAQASLDLREAMAIRPDAMVYNKTARQYESRAGRVKDVETV